MVATATRRERIVVMLKERGVDKPDDLMETVIDADLDGVLGAIALFDDMQKGFKPPGPGLLVTKIKQGGMPGYKRPHDRTEPEGSFGGGLTPEVLRSITGQILGAGMTRHEAREHFEKYAHGLATPVDALLDSAMGQSWELTPPHPANSYGWKGEWVYPPEAVSGATARYGAFVGARRKRPPDLAAMRTPGESDWDFACRYWDWTDPPEVLEEIAKRNAQPPPPRPAAPTPDEHAELDAERAAKQAERNAREAEVAEVRRKRLEEEAKLPKPGEQAALIKEAPASALTGEVPDEREWEPTPEVAVPVVDDDEW